MCETSCRPDEGTTASFATDSTDDGSIGEDELALSMLKTCGCTLLIVTNGDRKDMPRHIVYALDRFCDGILVFTWNCMHRSTEVNKALYGPHVEIINVRQGSGYPLTGYRLPYDATTGGSQSFFSKY